MKNWIWRHVPPLAALCLMAGCGVVSPSEEERARTGLMLTTDIDGGTDVAGIRFTFTRVSCPGDTVPPPAFSLTVDRDLEDVQLPGGILGLVGAPFDGASSHLFADAFVALAPGCYDIITTPFQAGGSPSADCASATRSGVHVLAEQTTELLLINQCGSSSGDGSGGTGGVDVISALNHPPRLLSLTFEPSKFVPQCSEQRICATAKDPDDDPLEFAWSQLSGPAPLSGPTVVSTTVNADGSTTQCVSFRPAEPGLHMLQVLVFDLLHDPATGALIRYEDYYAALGTPMPSRATLNFPSYATVDEDGACSCARPPGGGQVPTSPSCAVTPPDDGFEPVVEWYRDGVDGMHEDIIMMTPVVGNLSDDNGDGKVDTNDTPDIAYVVPWDSRNPGNYGAVRVVSGAGGAEICTTPSLVTPSSGLAIADTDGDGKPELYAMGPDGALISFTHTCKPRWTCTPSTARTWTHAIYPSIADADGDGDAEILLGYFVCDHLGALVAEVPMEHGGTSFFQDVDQDGVMEIVSGTGISRLDGTPVASFGIKGSSAAVGNFDADPAPEFVVTQALGVSGTWLSLYEADGTLVWARKLPQGSPSSFADASAPSIADLDLDGEPEIGVATDIWYLVYEADGTLKRQWPTTDVSSQFTSSSIADLDGRPGPEIVYADEETLWIFNVNSAPPLDAIAMMGHDNGTIAEYPVVADVDRDGRLEIVVASGRLGNPEWTPSRWKGLVVVGEKLGRWHSGRPVWNQYAWHGTQIRDDLSVPSPQAPNWLGANDFRAVATFSAGVPAPDLEPVLVESCHSGCPTTEAIRFQIQNVGAAMAPAGTPWTLYCLGGASPGVLASGTLPTPLPQGQLTPGLEVSVTVADAAGCSQLVLAVDENPGTGLSLECDESNNLVVLPPLCQ